MPIGAIIAGVIGAAGIGVSLSGAKKAERAAKSQAAEEARLEGIVTEEKLRQMNIEEMVTRGETIAAAAASGVEVGKGSVLDILSEQAYNFQRERGAVKSAGATRASNALARGSMAASQARYQGISTALNQAANIALLYQQYGGGAGGGSTGGGG